MTRLSAPAKSGFVREYETAEEARIEAAALLGVDVDDMIEVAPNDVTYCYASQEEADADQEGAYAVQYFEVSA